MGYFKLIPFILPEHRNKGMQKSMST